MAGLLLTIFCYGSRAWLLISLSRKADVQKLDTEVKSGACLHPFKKSALITNSFFYVGEVTIQPTTTIPG